MSEEQIEGEVQQIAQEVLVQAEVMTESEPDAQSADQCADQSAEQETATRSQAIVEALLFANGEELSVNRLCETSHLKPAAVEQALSALQLRYAAPEFGVELVQIAGKFQFRTKGEFATIVRELKASRPRRLSAAALETVAIVAYRQPIVKSDIEQIRGVDVTPTLKTLLERNLVRIVGHQPSVGSPALYGTTEEFLALFGLNSLAQLPTLRDLKEFEQEPGEGDACEPSEESPANSESTVAVAQ